MKLIIVIIDQHCCTLGAKIPFALRTEESNFIVGNFAAAQGPFMKL